MAKLDPLKILECQLGVDFERDTFPVVLDKLSASGMTTFRLNWKPDMVVCMAFEAEGIKRLNDALDVYLETLDQAP